MLPLRAALSVPIISPILSNSKQNTPHQFCAIPTTKTTNLAYQNRKSPACHSVGQSSIRLRKLQIPTIKNYGIDDNCFAEKTERREWSYASEAHIQCAKQHSEGSRTRMNKGLKLGVAFVRQNHRKRTPDAGSSGPWLFLVVELVVEQAHRSRWT
jgi:hypothetical protein